MQVEAQDRVLVEPALEGEGDAHLAELAGGGAGRAVLEQARDLHRQRRAAGDDAAVARRLERGAGEGDGVDAGVAAEAPVLEGEELAR